MLALGLVVGCDRVLGLDEFSDDASEAGGSAQDPAGFVRIEAGSFTMGSPVVEPGRLSDELEHRVTITRPFLMKASEVTQEDWFERTGQRPSFFQGCGDECPVEMVSWYEAIAFCNNMSLSEGLPACYEAQGQAYDFVHAKAHVEPSWPRGLTCTGYRLPTEAEWEYAARAGSNSAFHTGDVSADGCEEPTLAEAGWFCGNSKVTYPGCADATEFGGAACAGTHAVERKRPNAWGLYDVHGNVWEWVWDWHADYRLDQTDPVGPPDGEQRVGRGGFWYGRAGYCRAAKRLTGAPAGRGNHIGFRVARTAQ